MIIKKHFLLMTLWLKQVYSNSHQIQ